MADLRLHSSTSNLIRFTLKHATTGQGLTGLVFGSSGLIISTIADNEATAVTYTAAGSTIETIATLGTFAAPTATKCRFKEVDAVNHRGVYEFQFADARFSVASARRLIISVTGAASLMDADYEIQLVSFNPYDAVRMGLTALPNAVAEAAGGLYTRGTGAGQINQPANGMVDANIVRLGGVAQSLTDLKDFADDGYDPSTNKIAGVVLADTVTTYTGNTPQTGDNYARIGALGAGLTALSTQASVNTIDGIVDDILADTADMQPKLGTPAVSISADLAAIEAQTDDIGAAGAGLTAADDAILAAIAALNNLSAAQVNTEVDTALSDYDPPIRSELTTDINSVLARIGPAYTTGTVVTDGGNTAQTFKTNLAATDDNAYVDAWMTFTTGDLVGQTKRVTAFVASTDFVTVHAVYTDTPANGDAFFLVNR